MILDAIEKIETELTKLGIKDIFGEVCEGIEASAYVSKVLGPRFDEPDDQLYAGKISVDEYLNQKLSLIQEFDRVRQDMRIERKLNNLHLDQIELDLLGAQSA